VIDEAVVELAFTVSTKPVVISGSLGDSEPTGVSTGSTGFRYLLMPRRLLS
jgi:DNA polymerase-3 subunit beta